MGPATLMHASTLIQASVPIQKFQSSRGHLCILSQKYFPIASVDREKLENHNYIYFMAFALKGKVLKIVKEKVISTCGRSHYVMQ